MPGFSSTYSPLFLALFLLISIAASVYFYRNTLLAEWKKYFLISVKSLALFLLLALFAEPVLSSFVSPDSEKLDIILIDNSRSNKTGSKEEEIKTIISDGGFLGNDYKVFSFSNNITPLNTEESLSFTGFETGLSGALKNIKAGYPDRVFNSVTIISDGIFNAGGNPLYEARTFNAPFITVPVGDTSQQNDVVLSNAVYNDKAFTNTPVKVMAYINAYGYTNGILKVNILREGAVISTKEISLTPAQQVYEAEFDITEGNAGKVKYSIETERKENELTYKNNNYDFYITYTENKINVLVISGGPGYDNAFITGVLKRINNYNITFRTAKSPGEFYEGGIDAKALPELSALFLLNFPTSQTIPGIITELANSVKSFNIPVIFFAGKNSDYQKLQSFEESIPFNISRPGSGEAMFSLQVVASEDNALSRLTEVNSTAQIFRNVAGIQPKPGAVTIATDKFSGEPVMMTQFSDNYKSTAFLGYGLWRWRLNSSNNAEKTLEKLLVETINMTLQKEKKTKFKVYPAKDFFDYSENIKITAEVFDESYIPTRNALVTGKIIRKDGSKAADLKFEPEENKYSAYTPPLTYGDYSIEADAELGGSFYAKDYSRFFVDTTNYEFLITKSNYQALNELSQNTGGTAIAKDDRGNIKSLINNTKNPNITESTLRKSIRFNLWENKFYLALVILLFTIEWVMRKRNNIP